jgi:type VI secretion system protein ImpD
MARDRVGAFTSAADLQKYLNDWLRGYMLGNADAGAELKARYPLSGGGIEVKEIPGRPGIMNCVIHLQPHFQFDQMVSGFKLRTELQAAYPV